MFKIVGICILLFAIFYISSTVCEKERSRVHLLSEMSKFLHEVRHSLTVFMKPMSDICKDFKTDEQYFAQLLRDELEPLKDDKHVRELAMIVGNDASSVFVDFVSGFGRGYLSDEISRCNDAIKRFDDICAGERAGAYKSLRVYRTLGVALSFALIILFI